ncbi:MAG TPA: DUF938 domain-containing protein [Pseudomonadota bacterium]|jgi:cyclopropane fatty-acyl-phospholipid synthase-like methyltransferase|nr:DUF938 domain-containing protein [Pseudomonadota bacterium]HNG00069.1 DUF938 domain-containing protein [Pseudomonadota bacterium]HNI58944.1 DUF938 domain-containing protein [Pseudomonadota bacterium]HNK43671.1 DUF938 domain-containing protein [Pseudomonadota bacterium]HNN50070.1 DUF938 domain-containing protein [Pseudomonadota bacterium]
MEKPFAPSCERNRDPILAVLQKHFADRRDVLEIGSGTGQHAVYFARALPQLRWQTSECAEHLAGISAWLDEAQLPNTPPPIELDVTGTWPRQTFDAVFSANTLHIMPWTAVCQLFAKLHNVLTHDAKLVVYGAFNYGGRFTSPSNAAFDDWLKASSPQKGIRDVESVHALAATAGLALVEDCEMPSHNRCLIWQRR